MGRRFQSRCPGFLTGLACATVLAGSAAGAGGAGGIHDPATLVPHPTRALLLDLVGYGATHFAAGAHGVIVRTPDAGATWHEVPTPVSTMLTCITFADTTRGWAAGHAGVLITTADGGSSWRIVDAGTSQDDSFLDVLALPGGHILAVGAYGLFLASRDGGETWERRNPLDEDMHLNRITAGASGTLYLAGEAGTLALSRDKGASWQRLEPPYDGSFFGLHELPSGRLLAHGLRGHAYFSDDDGATWAQSAIEHNGLLATAALLKDGRVLLSGAGGRLFVSIDDGATFTPLAATGLTAAAEILAADGILLCAGDTGVRSVRLPTP